MKLLITGAGGYFAGYLIRELLRDDSNTIWAVTSNVEKVRKYGVLPVENSCLSSIDCGNIDCVIHCAYPQGADGGAIASGLDFTRQTLELTRRIRVNRFINISSQSVYGSKRKGTADEHTAPCLDSLYSLGKYATELLTEAYCDQVPHISVRMASLIGPDFDKRFLNTFVKRCILREDIDVVSGNEKISFLDVRDAAKAVAKLAYGWDCHERVINLRGNDPMSILEYAMMVNKIAEERNIGKVNIHFTPKENETNSSLNGEKMINLLNLEPRMSLRQSIEDIFEYQRTKKN